MPVDRRKFISRIGKATGAIAVSSFFNPVQAASLETAFQNVRLLSPEACATDEDFWQQIRLAYRPSATILDLNNGGVSPQPRIVQEALEHYNRLCNEVPSYYMWRHLDRGKDVIREKLATIAGCSAENIAITRNTSEALETVIFGLRLQAGDEVVLSKQGYPNLINAWKQREMRDGIVLRWLDFDLPQENPEYFVAQYKAAITDRTKILYITHVINWTGQVLPVKEIAALAQDRIIEVVVDGAHSFAQLEYTIPDLNCDYFGTSLHKWLGAPFGTGMLYVRESKIKNLFPLFAANDPEEDNIRKFENIGTRSSATEHAIVPAVDFHEMIGTARKGKRLCYLKDYWITRLQDLPGFRLHSPRNTELNCGIALFSLEGQDSVELSSQLYQKFNIHTVAINWENIHGLRITPNVYTLPRDLDRFVDAIKTIVNT